MGKHIHILLVALLCYGQLVTNLHAIGHFDTAEAEVHDHSPLNGDAGTAHLILQAAAHAAHSHDIGNTDSNAESDCAIYHIYLNQGSVLNTAGDQVMAISSLATHPLPTLLCPESFAVQNPPIRAPPTLS